MRRTILIAVIGLSLGMLLGPAVGFAVDTQPKPQATVEQRLTRLETQMRNVERLTGLDLSDDRAIDKHLRDNDIALKAASLISLCQTVRAQLELYQVQHRGVYPDLVNQGWAQLTQKTHPDGKVHDPKAPQRGVVVGPYLLRAPVNPITGSAKVVGSPKDIGPGVGWAYNRKTGKIHPVVSAVDAKRYRLSADDVITY